jgi:hypothetical protein
VDKNDPQENEKNEEINCSLSRASPVAWMSFLEAYIATIDQKYEVRFQL